ncbi:MAG: hypothetical protein J5822_03770 [Eubacteriaceae bacterium]|nr:hypothetical protein [Eubacteriaceae bacterium]
MRIDKYASDWRLENEEKDGKIKTVTVYRGEHHHFTDPAAAASYRLKAALAVMVLIVTAIGSVFLKIDTFRTWYSNMPFYISMFFLLFLSDSVNRFIKAEDGMIIREDADKIYSRYMIDSFMGLLFVCASFIGCIAAVITKKTMAASDWGFIALVLVHIVVYVYLIVHKDCVKIETNSKKDN